MKILLVIFYLNIILSCVYGQNEVSPKLNNYLLGKWVMTSGEKDTIEFGKLNSEKLFVLTKQYGTKPHKNPEGLYEFKLTPKGINLQWIPSSTITNSGSD